MLAGCSARRSGQSSCGVWSRPRRTRGVALSRLRATRSARTLAELDGALVDADDLHEPLASFVRSYRDGAGAARRLGSRASPTEGDRAADGRGRRRGATARCSRTASRTSPGPNGGSSRHSRHGPTSMSPCRTSPAAPSTPRSRGRPATLPPSPGDGSSSCRRGRAEFLPPPLAHVERELFARDGAAGAS